MSNGKFFKPKTINSLGNFANTKWISSLLIISLFFLMPTVNAQLFVEKDGLVVIEVESATDYGKWEKATSIPDFSGTAYFIGTADNLGVGGKEILNYKISIKTRGIYQLQVRSKIGEGTKNTDFNDSWLRMLGRKGEPMSPVTNDNVVTNSWYKYYQNKMAWTWQTSNKDWDPRSLAWDLTPGKYWVQISMRSKGHAVDKIVLFNRSMHTLANLTTGDSNGENNKALDALALSKIASDSKPLPPIVKVAPPKVTSKRFNKKKDILLAQFDNKPDPDDIHSQAAFACLLAHPDGAGINYYAVTGAYGTQKGKYINSNTLFKMAFGDENVNWTDAHADRAGSVARIVAEIKPVLKAGGSVWVQEAGQSDITADWIAQLLTDGLSAKTIKKNVIIVQHSVWNENATSKEKLTYVKNVANYIDIDDGNVDFGNYDKHIQRLAPTPMYVSSDKNLIINAMSPGNPNVKASELWTEADRLIKESGFKEKWSEIVKGGVDFSDCVENWFILNLGDNLNSAVKFWERYVINTPEI